jgi:hypothetical protein
MASRQRAVQEIEVKDATEAVEIRFLSLRFRNDGAPNWVQYFTIKKWEKGAGLSGRDKKPSQQLHLLRHTAGAVAYLVLTQALSQKQPTAKNPLFYWRTRHDSKTFAFGGNWYLDLRRCRRRYKNVGSFGNDRKISMKS